MFEEYSRKLFKFRSLPGIELKNRSPEGTVHNNFRNVLEEL